MPDRDEYYKCEVCGNIVTIVHASDGELVCCGEPMKLLKANTVEASKEKHIPIVEKKGTTYTVKVGSEPHPMEKEHYIEVIELMIDGKLSRTYMQPGQKPEAVFTSEGKVKGAREYCTLHGLWKNQ